MCATFVVLLDIL